MKYQVTSQQGVATARVTGQMTFDDRAAAPSLASALMESSPSQVVIDLTGVDYIDSAGLGILLTLRERAEEKNVKVALKGMAGSVKEVLELACFDTLFAFQS